MKTIKNVFFTIITIVCVFVCLFTFASTLLVNRNDRAIMGYKIYAVLSDSMSATDFSAGDLIFSKEVDVSTLVVGDVITFISYDQNSKGETVTHKIGSINKDRNGNLTFTTYGTSTGVEDSYVVSEMDIQGKYEFAIPLIGYFFVMLKKPIGYVCFILIPFMAIILMQLADTIKLYKQYKAEVKKEEKKEENQKLSDMEKQIAELKAQLEQQKKAGINE